MLQLEDVFRDDLQIFQSRYKSRSDEGFADDGGDEVADREIVSADLFRVLAKWRHLEVVVFALLANTFCCVVSALLLALRKCLGLCSPDRREMRSWD